MPRRALPAAGFECELLAARARAAEPRRAAARRRRRARRCACSATSTRFRPIPASGAATRGAATLVDGEVWGRGALDMKDQVAAEVAACLALARDGWRPARGSCCSSSPPTRRREPTTAPSGSARSTPTRSAATSSSTRAAAWRSTSTAAASTPSRVGEKGVFRLHASHPRPSPARLAAADRRQRAAEARRRCSSVCEQPPRRRADAGGARLPRGAARRGGRARPRLDAAALRRLRGRRPGCGGVHRRADARRHPDADDGRAPRARRTSIPSPGRAARRLPRAAGDGEADVRERVASVLGDDGYEIEFARADRRQPLRSGDRLADAIERLARRRRPGRRRSCRW